MNKLRITPSVIPNMFTAMNMFCGFLSIVYSSEKQFLYAGILIVIAAIFDALDGAMARLTKSSSLLGVELDSLSDVVSFGAAPSFLIYSTYFYTWGALGMFISSMQLIAGGFRLARFNVQLVGFEKSHFKGLPIPAAALTLVSFVMAFFHEGSYPKNVTPFIIPLVVLVAFLMVSNIKYDTFPKFNLAGLKEKPLFPLILLFSIAAFLFTKSIFITFFLAFIFLVAFGIFRSIISALFSKSKNKS